MQREGGGGTEAYLSKENRRGRRALQRDSARMLFFERRDGGGGRRRRRSRLEGQDRPAALDLEVALAAGELADLCVVGPSLRGDGGEHARHLGVALGE